MTDYVETVKGLIAHEKLPNWIRNVDVALGVDATDEPAVWVNLLVDDTVADDPGQLAELTAILRNLRSILVEKVPDRWSYVQAVSGTEEDEG